MLTKRLVSISESCETFTIEQIKESPGIYVLTNNDEDDNIYFITLQKGYTLFLDADSLEPMADNVWKEHSFKSFKGKITFTIES